MNEMPLLVFTILEQTAVGAFVALVAMRLAGKTDRSVGFKAGMTLFALVVVGMIASLFHLGQPMRAMNVLAGIGSSWLSREILFIGLFAVCALVWALLEKFDKAGAAKAFGVIGAVFGIAAVVSTAAAYMLPGVPAWDSALTPAQFVLTAVVCGIPLYGALSAAFTGSKKAAVWWVVFAVLLLTQIAMRYVFFSDIVLLIDSV